MPGPMSQRYKRPPITEAVIELRFEPPVERDLLDRANKRLLENYPLAAENQIINVEVGDAAATVQRAFQGYRLTSLDGTAIVTLAPNLIATSRLAPYEGWDPFAAAARS